jgi:hypothetical protein
LIDVAFTLKVQTWRRTPMGAMVQTINNTVTRNNSVKMTTLEKEMAVH